MFSHYADNIESLLSMGSTPEMHTFNTKLYASLTNSKDKIPDIIVKLYPNITMEKY
jgi:hypothetical protein